MSGTHNHQHDHAMMLWGHSLNDYKEMFALTEEELKQGVLDLEPGPASFNVEAKQLGYKVTSVDDLFAKPIAELKQEVNLEFSEMLQIVKQHKQNFQWDEIASLADLAVLREAGMQRFFDDYQQGLEDGRYLADPITQLPFKDFEFKLALCSHFLFNYRDTQNCDEVVTDLIEMARVAVEVRVFPLIDNRSGELSPLVGPVLIALQEQHFAVEVLEVPYKFQKNGNAMLKARSLTCEIQVPNVSA